MLGCKGVGRECGELLGKCVGLLEEVRRGVGKCVGVWGRCG